MRTSFMITMLVCSTFALFNRASADDAKITKYVHFKAGETTAYGTLDSERITELSGRYAQWKKTEKTHNLKDVKILVPVPSHCKILALAGNYRSHLATQPAPLHPEFFFKLPSSLLPNEGTVIIPKGTERVDYEAELVIVIGKKAKNVSEEQAPEYILGVTCGNDISARDWQKGDRQWWRAKACDTFAPCGPVIVSGIKYDDLKLQLRQNGKVKQDTRTSDMIHNTAQIVSWASRHITLDPGDIIYTGTTGTTEAIHPGDTLEVEIEGVGTLRNSVSAAQE